MGKSKAGETDKPVIDCFSVVVLKCAVKRIEPFIQKKGHIYGGNGENNDPRKQRPRRFFLFAPPVRRHEAEETVQGERCIFFHKNSL